MIFSPEVLFKDFCIMSMIIIIAQILRMRFPFFQNHFIPVSLMAGVIGMFGGKYGLRFIPFSDSISSYSGLLVMFLSASLFIGNSDSFSFKKMLETAGDSFLLNCASEIGQFGLSITLGGILSIWVFHNINSAFGILMPAGFVGDHGTAAVVGATLESGGFTDAIGIAQTFATFGLLTGIFGGVFCINIAVKKGYTNYIREMSKVPIELRTGIIPEQSRISMGNNVFSPNVMDTLTWNVALVLCAITMAYGISYIWGKVIPTFPLPVYGIALITGILLNEILKKLHLVKYVDRKTMTRIGGTATDYLIAFGISSINIKMVLSLWQPILIFTVVGILYTIIYLFLISRHCAGKNWFEKGIFIFGWSAGAMPIAIMLLKISDPDGKSHVLEECSFSWVFLTLVDMAIIAFVPTLLLKGAVFLTGSILLILAIVFIMISFFYYGRKQTEKI